MRIFFCIVIYLGAITLVGCSNDRIMASQVKVCHELQEKRCLTHGVEFTTETPEIFASTITSNLPTDSTVIFLWSYAENGEDYRPIKRFEITSQHPSQILTSSLSKLDSEWPTGNYRVTLQASEAGLAPISADFTIGETAVSDI